MYYSVYVRTNWSISLIEIGTLKDVGPQQITQK